MRFGFFLFFFAALASTQPVSASDSSPRFLVHLLDYLAKDYGGAVSEGRVISPSEYEEQLEFSESALKAARSNPEISKVGKTWKDLLRLKQMIEQRADAERVAELARALQTQVIEISGLTVSPQKWPSLKRGKQLFAQNCVSCHGASGRGDGPAGKGLNPPPANFHDPERMPGVSPFQAFNTIRLGVPGTGMRAFNELADKDVWDLSFYLVSLRHKKTFLSNAAAPELLKNPETLKKIASTPDSGLENTLLGLRLHSDDDDSANFLGEAVAGLELAEREFRAGKSAEAKTAAVRAYLEGIEPVEARLKANSPELVIQLEQKMGLVRAMIEQGRTSTELAAEIGHAKTLIERAQDLLKEKEVSPILVLTGAAAVILREGFEAVLILLALLTVIRAAGASESFAPVARRAALWVHSGWLGALACGGLAWFFSGWVMSISGARREMMEAVTSLFAVVVLLYLGFWLHSQTEMRRWKAFIDGKVKGALEGKNLLGLATISFVAVFREAFETVLFLRAIWIDGGDKATTALSAGVFGSLALIIVSAWALLRFSIRIPVRKVFTFSSVLMAGLALILTGKGLHSLQETGALSISSSPFSWRSDLLGFYPTWETVAAQGVILLISGMLWTLGKRPRT